MSVPTVLVDIDGCLADFNPEFLRLLNIIRNTRRGQLDGDLGFPGNLAEPNTWQWFEPAGFTKGDVRLAWDHVKAHPSWWSHLEAYWGVTQFLMSLQNATARGQIVPYFVTSRPSQRVAEWTSLWLTRYGFARPNVVVVTGTGRKAHVALAVGATAILDDHGPNFAGLPGDCRRFLFDRPWNQDDEHEVRITSLQAFLRAVVAPAPIFSFSPSEAA